MKFVSKIVVSVAIMALLLVAPVSGSLLSTQASAATATPQQQTTQQTNADINISKSMLSWGVLLFAVGEFASLLGLGIANVRKAKRQEAREKKQQQQPKGEQILLYSEYKKRFADAKAK